MVWRPERLERRRARAGRRLGRAPPRPRRADLHRPARPLRDPAARLSPGERRRDVRRGGAAARRVRRLGRGRRRAARGAQHQPRAADRRDRACGHRHAAAGGVADAAVSARRGDRARRDPAPASPHARPAPPLHGRGARAAQRRRADDPPGPRRRGLPRDRDADPHALDARRRARLPRSRTQRAGQLLRAAAVAAALQAAAHDRRLRALLPDRALLSRRGSARRPPARVHPARPRDVVRRRGRRHRRQRALDGEGVRSRRPRRAATAV